jgi:rod shape determining protein RodA
MVSLRRFDWLLFLPMLLISAIGCAMIYSAYEISLSGGPRTGLDNLALRQAFFALIGLVCYLIASALDYRLWVAAARWLYPLIIAMLLVTLAIADPTFGTRAWLNIGTFGIQPSELARILMIIVFAHILGAKVRNLESPTAFLISAVLLLPIVALVYLQVDFGMALMMCLIWIGMVFLAGVRWRHLAVVATAAAAAIPLVWFQLEAYMRGRIFHFLYPGQDPSGASYNVNQALISIGSGGWWGKGFGQGTQSQLQFLRVRHTDFIFSVFCEEFGFIGAILLILLFAVLVLRLLHIADGARDRSGRLIAGGVAVGLFAQVFINLGMNANILPVTGLPLPMVSSGGSSLIATMLALGLAQSVAMRQKPPDNPLL